MTGKRYNPIKKINKYKIRIKLKQRKGNIYGRPPPRVNNSGRLTSWCWAPTSTCVCVWDASSRLHVVFAPYMPCYMSTRARKAAHLDHELHFRSTAADNLGRIRIYSFMFSFSSRRFYLQYSNVTQRHFILAVDAPPSSQMGAFFFFDMVLVN